MSDLKTARPLSPHLSIYRFRPTMAMSILHRITGSALYVGTLLFVWWLVAAASGPEAFSYASAFFGSIIGRIILFGYTWALLHHMFGGIRHLIWDTGIGLSKETSTKLAQATLVASLALTLILWVGIVVFG
ncbi:MAG: succinate dehydrogenase, cytochrome b556 subunit [Aurantimonas coralicida]|jgi:succinate dehydrogenase / fumarate reductase, cytochrome b subunit|uniref:Succinate dehydrogenase cytochrome b556 subunit n=1 Tax=Aurantimonas coralicida TaxID=182270 RepID=A0A0N7KXD3_9HYPH|nr:MULTISPECIES: succinate dehydrogenase, cytochrome b556 subunit [Aurantimonas]MAP18918.1 succinate dehydrogenase, cytochrome b556 subunit [Aurantimonas sp.]MCW7543823.1 succinate dehydrogenase, cytochrome b556 subunit [Aurantimonas litoralis]MAY28097.1 succinate dehydrogenase, cytochrome b556 subunit [Aurantimonas sp.]MBC6717448.1 succinate dehydrogenase, cytochrome b556 subunit [Aurantimonas sp. DM33-3]MCC4298922.1 succinate dehydrogenase, cytochrome b556 subunit [Aurantimonas coralicida]|tara:strand:+ start:202 stop:594 length:393 start_codon:yes stop_codon:yes gene_type:complete